MQFTWLLLITSSCIQHFAIYKAHLHSYSNLIKQVWSLFKWFVGSGLEKLSNLPKGRELFLKVKLKIISVWPEIQYSSCYTQLGVLNTRARVMTWKHEVNHVSPFETHQCIPTSLRIKVRVSPLIFHPLRDLPLWWNPSSPLPPQGLCTCWFLFLQCSSPKYLPGFFYHLHCSPQYLIFSS